MFRNLILVLLLALSFDVSAAKYLQITTDLLDDDANGICEDQTIGSAGNLTLDGTLVEDGVGILNEAQIISIESAGNLSGVTFTVSCTDADGVATTEAVTGPNNSTVKTTNHCETVTQIAVDGAVGTNVEIGALAADGMVTESVRLDHRQTPFNATLAVELSAGTGTFGVQYSVDLPNGTYAQSYLHTGSWRDAQGLDPDDNTATGEDNVAFPVRAVRGLVTTGSTTGVYKFTFIQGDAR